MRYARNRDDAVEDADARTDLGDVRNLRDAGDNERVECAAEEAVDGREEHDRGEVGAEWPDREDHEARAESGRYHHVEPAQGVGETRGDEATEDSTGVHDGEHIERGVWGDAVRGGVVDNVEEGDEQACGVVSALLKRWP